MAQTTSTWTEPAAGGRLIPLIVGAVLAYAAAQFVRYVFVPSDLGVFDPLARFEDDAFYYFEVARNVVERGAFTFDGVTTTNGFHPLWMAVVIAIGSVLPIGSFGFHLAVVTIAAVAITIGSFRLFALLSQTSLLGDAKPSHRMLAAGAAAAFYQFCGLEIGARGMEVALTLMLVPFVLARMLAMAEQLAAARVPSFRDGLVASLLASLLVLSRLDAILFVVAWGLVLLGLLVANGRLRDATQRAPLLRLTLAVLAGALPLLLYLGFNLWATGELMPVSGRAKRLIADPSLMPSAVAFASIIDLNGAPLYVACKAAWLALGFVVAPIALAFEARRLREAGSLLCLATTIATWVFYALLVTSSDWDLWPWYFWAVLVNAAIGLSLSVTLVLRNRPSLSSVTAAGLVAVVAVFAVVQSLRPFGGKASDLPNVVDAIALRDFAAAHPGSYAMGDRAGAAAYLTDQPVIQLEGLMGDGRIVDAIARQTPLAGYLATVEADYYVTAWVRPDADGCHAFVEPAKAGPAAPSMRGRSCAAPVATFSGGTRIWRVGDLERAAPATHEVR